MSRPKIAILGSGSMATACAVSLSDHADQTLSMWARREESAAALNRDRENKRLLPGIPLPDGMTVSTDASEVLTGAGLILLSIPTKYLRATLETLRGPLSTSEASRLPFVSVVKGLENESMLRPSEIVRDVLGEREVFVFGGPCHAEELARRLPASVTLSGADSAATERVQELFRTDRLRVYSNADVVGTELAGAVKNVIAIAAGLCDGMGYGDNAKSALLTRGTLELARYGTARGGQAETFTGLAGIGDLMTTCFSKHGRNRYVGEQLGLGKTLSEIESEMAAVPEGVNTTRSVYQDATACGIEMPIVDEVFQVLFEGKSPEDATDSLMQRPPRPERS